MRNAPALFSVVLLSIIFCMTSCVKDPDLEQVENRSNIDVFKSDIISLDKPIGDFFDDNADKIAVSDTINIENIIRNNADGNLIKTDFIIEVTNSTNHSYQVEFDFLNKDHELQYTIGFGVAASHNNRDIVFKYDEVFEELELELIKASSTIVPKLSLIPNDDYTPDSTKGKLKLKSSASFYFGRDSSE